MQIIVPISDQQALSAVFLRAPPQAPIELIVAALAAILLASTAAALMARRVVRPLSELTKAAAKVAVGSGAPHVNEEGPADVRNAAAAFNLMERGGQFGKIAVRIGS